MTVDGSSVSNLLAIAWEHWAQRCRELTSIEWAIPTRCPPWNVAALAAHLVPDPDMFDQIAAGAVDGPTEVTTGADLLRRFNAPDGVAHTMADDLATTAVTAAASLQPVEIVERFATCSDRVRSSAMASDTVVAHPVVGTTTLDVMAEIALMEATVHHLDLIAAVGGSPMPAPVLAHTCHLLVDITDPTALIEVLAGRRTPDAVLPVIR